MKLPYLVLIASAAALGGLLFGFDTAVISGAIGLFRVEFGLSQAMVGWVASSAIAGCFFGALIAGFLSDGYGRKKVLMLSACFFFISAVWVLNLHSAGALVAARLVGGLGIGIASVVSPVYISEISPALLRGRLMAVQQFAVVLGILAAFFSNSCIMNTGLSDPSKWRWMFGAGSIPSVLFFFSILLVPESPRWLLGKGSTKESSLKDLFKPGIRRAFFVGVLLAFFTQVTGINAIMYYAPEIFTHAGVAISSAFSYAVWIGLVNIVFTLIAMSVVDKFGRRPLLLAGIMCMTLALSYMGYAFYTRASGIGLLLGVLVYVASFAMSLGVVGWVIFSEIFPTIIRGRAVSVVTGVVWVTCFLVSMTFPVLMRGIGGAAVFAVYSMLSLAAFAFVYRYVPETKGKSLEEIATNWT